MGSSVSPSRVRAVPDSNTTATAVEFKETGPSRCCTSSAPVQTDRLVMRLIATAAPVPTMALTLFSPEKASGRPWITVRRLPSTSRVREPREAIRNFLSVPTKVEKAASSTMSATLIRHRKSADSEEPGKTATCRVVPAPFIHGTRGRQPVLTIEAEGMRRDVPAVSGLCTVRGAQFHGLFVAEVRRLGVGGDVDAAQFIGLMDT